jgi:MFS family permease
MGWAASLPSIASFIVMIGLGFMYDKFLMGKEKIVMLTSIVGAGVFVYLTFIASTVTLGVASMAISTIAISVLMQANMVVVVKYFPHECTGMAGGIANFANQIAGFLMPAFMGYILTRSGGNYSFIFTTVIIVLAIAFCVALTINTKKQAAAITSNSTSN